MFYEPESIERLDSTFERTLDTSQGANIPFDRQSQRVVMTGWNGKLIVGRAHELGNWATSEYNPAGTLIEQ